MCRGELIELEDKMFLLVLEDYAEELEAANKGKRLKQFEAIKQELRFPWYDNRRPLAEPSTKELFTLITGETDQSLYVGMKVGCRVQETRRGGATVIIDNGMRGNVNISKISDMRIDDIDSVLRVRGLCLAWGPTCNNSQGQLTIYWVLCAFAGGRYCDWSCDRHTEGSVSRRGISAPLRHGADGGLLDGKQKHR